jgi:FKBP-type peptidyl-prolyl cis-trans isomerases 1
VRRTLPVLSLALASALVLAGCAGEPETDPTGSSAEPIADVDVCATRSGDAVAAIDVSGDFGVEPGVEFAAPLTVDETEREVVISGDDVAEGALVQIAYAFYNGATGERIDAFGWNEGETAEYLRASVDFLIPGFAKTIGCLGIGSRAVAVIPADEGFGEAGAQFGLGADDALVWVVDVVGDAAWESELPVIGGTAEAPTVTLPATEPLTDLRIATLEEGDGPVVGPADSVTVHYLGTAWETGEVFDQSYSRGAPATFSVQGVVQGFSQALIGQKVGSRVIVSMPPALGYGASQGHALQNSTLVFLIDIVDTASAG